LIAKFMANYFFNPAEYPAVPRQDQVRNDDFLFNQGRTGGLSQIRLHDYNSTFGRYDLPNVSVFREQVEVFKHALALATPDQAQRQDVDFLLTLGEIFTLVVYGQLVLENAQIYQIDDDLVDQIFDCLVRDLSGFALELYAKPSSTPAQMDYCLKMIRKPAVDEDRYQRVWRDHVYTVKGAYAMNS